MRGFVAIGLDNPKSGENVGGTLRAAGVYGASLVVLGGPRPDKIVRHPTDTMKAWRHIPTIMVPDVMEVIPYKSVPVAVDLVEGATPLPEFKHPERAYYIFGAEDATLGNRVLSKCAHRIMVPTSYCMNLAACVNVILYSRLAQQWKGE